MRQQIRVLALATIAWGLLGPPVLAAAIGWYLAAIVVVEITSRWAPQTPAWARWLIYAAAGAALWVRINPSTDSGARALIFADQLSALGVPFDDRLRLETMPSIAPGTVFSDHPQTFYVSSQGARSIVLTIDAQPTNATRLGPGVFRFDFSPTRTFGADEVDATVTIEGREYHRRLLAIDPIPHPRWLSSSPSASVAATVSHETDELIIVRWDGELVRKAVGDGPIDAAVLADGRVAISHRFDPSLWIVDTSTSARRTEISLGPSQGRVALSPSGRLLAVLHDGPSPALSFVDPIEAVRTATLALSFRPDWIAFGESDDVLLVTDPKRPALVRVRKDVRGWRTEGAPLVLTRPASTLARRSHGREVLIATTDHRPAGTLAPNHLVEDQILIVRVDPLRIVDRILAVDAPASGPQLASPLQIESLPDAERIAFAGSSAIAEISAGSGQLAWARSEPTPLRHPIGLATLGRADAARRVLTSSAEGRVIVSSRNQVIADHRLDASIRAKQRLQRNGEAAFFEATRSGAACQSCHLHADSDDAIHDIGHGQRRPTLSVRGIVGTAPYLRGASYPDLASLVEVTETIFGGYAIAADRAGPLEAFVGSLPGRPNPTPSAPDLEEGYATFVRADCPLCHPPPAFTNLGQIPRGVLFPGFDEDHRAWMLLDVPSLIGLWQSGPYLSDGRATTIEEVLEDHNDQNRHGNTAALSDEEMALLLRFLRSL